MKFTKLVKANYFEDEKDAKLEELFPCIDKLHADLNALKQGLELANEYPTNKITIRLAKEKFDQIDSLMDDIDRILMGEF